jgi:hypothetical protein
MVRASHRDSSSTGIFDVIGVRRYEKPMPVLWYS